LQLGIPCHNYQQTAGSKQSVGNTVMKYAIAVAVIYNKKNMLARINGIRMYVCIMYVRMCVVMYVYMFMQVRMCVYSCTYVCMYVYVYMCICVYVCMYVCMDCTDFH
jgi:hypothetical protein